MDTPFAVSLWVSTGVRQMVQCAHAGRPYAPLAAVPPFPQSLNQLALVCGDWRALARSDALWRPLFLELFPLGGPQPSRGFFREVRAFWRMVAPTADPCDACVAWGDSR
jgi:hypothetical protein